MSAAPGTGKTVIAIYRAHELSDVGKKVAMLVYRRTLTLMKYLESTVKSLGIKAYVNTWHSWIVDFYDNTSVNNVVPEEAQDYPEIYVYGAD